MSSYRGHTMTRLAGDIVLGSRQAVARFADRSVATVRRQCQAVACDVATRGELYDVDHAVTLLVAATRRIRHHAR